LRHLHSFPTRRSSDLLAATVGAPLVLITLILGLRHRYPKHRAFGRWAYPVWLFVSVTGPLTYLMLYGLGRPGYGLQALGHQVGEDRKSTRLNSSHVKI